MKVRARSGPLPGMPSAPASPIAPNARRRNPLLSIPIPINPVTLPTSRDLFGDPEPRREIPGHVPGFQLPRPEPLGQERGMLDDPQALLGARPHDRRALGAARRVRRRVGEAAEQRGFFKRHASPPAG